jgi:translation initiation factor 3 subunit C
VTFVPTAAELKIELILRKYQEVILSQRGKRGTDRSEQIELLSELQQLIADSLDVAPLTTALRVKLVFALVVALYDLHLNVLIAMAPATWDK